MSIQCVVYFFRLSASHAKNFNIKIHEKCFIFIVAIIFLFLIITIRQKSLNLHVRIPIHYLLCFASFGCCHPCYIFRLRDQLVKLGEEFHGFLTNPKYIVRFMNAGRLIRVSYILQFSQGRVHWTLY